MVVPTNVFSPFNAQATLWKDIALPLLFLPCSVHGRVSDIYRSYIAQYIVHNALPKKKLVFTKPFVVQNRNAHNYLSDFNAELPLYEKAATLVEYLHKRQYQFQLTIGKNMVQLYVDLYERGYIEELDINLMHRWSKWLGDD